MTYSHSVRPVDGFNLTASQRVCQTCRTTVTSQWRYGLSGKVLLCNACGIRWKRKNRTADKRKLKPGPKRTRQCATSTASSRNSYHGSLPHNTQPIVQQPSLFSMFYRPTMYSVLKPNVSSTSTITDARTERRNDSSQGSHIQQQASSSRTWSSSKMDIGSLMCPTNSTATMRPDVRKERRSTSNSHSSPISIRNLLNFADDDGASTVSSMTAPHRALRC